jgi:hypothetical protein
VTLQPETPASGVKERHVQYDSTASERWRVLATVSERLAWRGRNPADTSKAETHSPVRPRKRGGGTAFSSGERAAMVQSSKYDLLIKLLLIGDSGTPLLPPLWSARARPEVVCLFVLAALLTALTSTCRCRQELRVAPVLGRLVYDVVHHDDRVRLNYSLAGLLPCELLR